MGWSHQPVVFTLSALHRGRHRERWEHTAQRGADCRKLVCDSFTIPGNPQESLPCSILMYSLPQKPCFRTEPLNWRYFQGMGRLPPKARDHERVWRQENNVLKDYLNNLMAKVRVLCSVKLNYLLCVLLCIKNYSTHTHIMCMCVYIHICKYACIHLWLWIISDSPNFPFTLRYMLRLLRTSIIEVMRTILHKSCHQWLSFHDFSCGSGVKMVGFITQKRFFFHRHCHSQNHGRDEFSHDSFTLW